MSKWHPNAHEYTDEEIEYIRNNFSVRNKKQIAEYIGVSLESLKHIMRKLGIKKFKHVPWSASEIEILIATYQARGATICAELLGRSFGAVCKKAESIGLIKEYTYTYIDADGYYVTRRNRNESAKRVHRLIMEEILGRKLTTDEVVHHKDGNKLNNKPSNLQLMTRTEHINHHREDLQLAQGLRDSLG